MSQFSKANMHSDHSTGTSAGPPKARGPGQLPLSPSLKAGTGHEPRQKTTYRLKKPNSSVLGEIAVVAQALAL